jgi:hypothetical protein
MTSVRESSHRERALSALIAWHRERAWARTDPRKLAITSVELAGPLQVVLRSVFESRGVRYELMPAVERTREAVSGPDPWAQSLAQPIDAAVGHELQVALTGAFVPMDCSTCSASGELRCLRCDGNGRIQSGRSSYVCPECLGAGNVRCSTCRGSGGLVGAPTAWSRIDAHEEMRTAGADALPLEVALDLAETPVTGEVIFRREGERIADAQESAGYRDGAAIPPELAETVRSILAGSGVPEGTKLRRQALEVRRAPVFEVTLERGATVYVWGTPAKVFPIAPVSTLLGRLMPFLAR